MSPFPLHKNSVTQMYVENDPILLKMDKNNTLCTYTKSLKVRTPKCSQGLPLGC